MIRHSDASFDSLLGEHMKSQHDTLSPQKGPHGTFVAGFEELCPESFEELKARQTREFGDVMVRWKDTIARNKRSKVPTNEYSGPVGCLAETLDGQPDGIRSSRKPIPPRPSRKAILQAAACPPPVKGDLTARQMVPSYLKVEKSSNSTASMPESTLVSANSDSLFQSGDGSDRTLTFDSMEAEIDDSKSDQSVALHELIQSHREIVPPPVPRADDSDDERASKHSSKSTGSRLSTMQMMAAGLTMFGLVFASTIFVFGSVQLVSFLIEP